MNTLISSIAVVGLGAVLSMGAVPNAFANHKRPPIIQPAPKRCFSGDQSVASGQTATLENGKTYMCLDGHWDVPLEPLHPAGTSSSR